MGGRGTGAGVTISGEFSYRQPAFTYKDYDNLFRTPALFVQLPPAHAFLMNPHYIARTGKERGNDPASPAEWDRAYARQGRLWGGVPLPIPPLPVQSRILELGCGNGKTVAALSQKTENLIALDFSPQACRLARRQLAGRGMADILTADARAIPLTAGSVDAVIAYHVAGHLLHRDRLLLFRESARVLKRGGLFLFCDFSTEDFRCGTGEEDRKSVV